LKVLELFSVNLNCPQERHTKVNLNRGNEQYGPYWFFTHISFFCRVIVKKEVRFGVIILMDCKAGAEAGACQSDPVYMDSMSCNDFCAGRLQ